MVEPLGHVFTKQLWATQALVWAGNVPLSQGHNPPPRVKKSQHKPGGEVGGTFQEVSSGRNRQHCPSEALESFRRSLVGFSPPTRESRNWAET